MIMSWLPHQSQEAMSWMRTFNLKSKWQKRRHLVIEHARMSHPLTAQRKSLLTMSSCIKSSKSGLTFIRSGHHKFNLELTLCSTPPKARAIMRISVVVVRTPMVTNPQRWSKSGTLHASSPLRAALLRVKGAPSTTTVVRTTSSSIRLLEAVLNPWRTRTNLSRATRVVNRAFVRKMSLSRVVVSIYKRFRAEKIPRLWLDLSVSKGQTWAYWRSGPSRHAHRRKRLASRVTMEAMNPSFTPSWEASLNWARPATHATSLRHRIPKMASCRALTKCLQSRQLLLSAVEKRMNSIAYVRPAKQSRTLPEWPLWTLILESRKSESGRFLTKITIPIELSSTLQAQPVNSKSTRTSTHRAVIVTRSPSRTPTLSLLWSSTMIRRSASRSPWRSLIASTTRNISKRCGISKWVIATKVRKEASRDRTGLLSSAKTKCAVRDLYRINVTLSRSKGWSTRKAVWYSWAHRKSKNGSRYRTATSLF